MKIDKLPGEGPTYMEPISFEKMCIRDRDALSYFTRVPEDLNDRLEKFMSRYGKEMPDKDEEIKKRQAHVMSKQIDSVKAELEELNKKQIVNVILSAEIGGFEKTKVSRQSY